MARTQANGLGTDLAAGPWGARHPTNAIESLNMSLRKIIKNRSLFPNEDAMTKLLYLALRNIKKKWTMPIRDWGRALNQFAILFENRVPLN
jgi:putative transposase